MSLGTIGFQLQDGVPLEYATSVPRGIIRIQHPKAVPQGGIVIGIVSGAISSLCTAVQTFMPGCTMYDTSASVSNDQELNLAASITATPVWAAVSNA